MHYIILNFLQEVYNFLQPAWVPACQALAQPTDPGSKPNSFSFWILSHSDRHTQMHTRENVWTENPQRAMHTISGFIHRD